MSGLRVQRAMRAAAVAASVLCAAFLVGSGGAAATKVGERAADFTLPDLDGKTVKLSSLKGTVVVLDFWASWCGPCKKELPALDALAKRYRDAGKAVVVLALNIDRERANAEKFLATAKIDDLRVLLDPQGKTASAYDLPTMPSSFVIDGRGLIRKVHAGYASGDEKKLAAEIDRLLKD